MRPRLIALMVTSSTVLLALSFLLVNVITARHYQRFDWTGTRLHRLSPKTRQVLAQLHEPVDIIVFFQPQHRLHGLIQSLLETYRRETPQLHIEYLDPQQDPARARQLVKELSVDRLNLVIVRSANQRRYLTESDLADYDYQALKRGVPLHLTAFRGEEALTSALVHVTSAQERKLCLLTGHGEKSLDDAGVDGLGQTEVFLEREGFTAAPLSLLDTPEVPADCDLLMIPGPARQLLPQETSALDAYGRRGGRLLLLLDPSRTTGLEAWLRDWGVTVGDDIVVDPARQLPYVSPANLFVTAYETHPIVERLQALATLFPLVRSIGPSDRIPEGVRVTSLAMTSNAGWAETSVDNPKLTFQEGEDRRGPISIAVAVEGITDGSGRSAHDPVRMVVIGDSDFIANGHVAEVGNLDFLLACLHWLAKEEQLIAIGPKPLRAAKLTLRAEELSRVTLWTQFGLPALIWGFGLAVWWRRRH